MMHKLWILHMLCNNLFSKGQCCVDLFLSFVEVPPLVWVGQTHSRFIRKFQTATAQCALGGRLSFLSSLNAVLDVLVIPRTPSVSQQAHLQLYWVSTYGTA